MAWAEESEVFVQATPARYIAVNGDAEKFRAHHWMKDGFMGGINQLSANHLFANGVTLQAQGHALVDQNDLGSSLSLTKEGLGFFKADYSEFRKYYDGTGGMYHYFTTLQANDTDKDLALNIGRVAVETGLTLSGWPGLSFLYERKFKNGAKSRLTWTGVKEGPTTRNIGPSWQEIDEVVDSFAIQASHSLAGFDLKGEQRWEFARTETLREERNRATTGVAADQKIRRQEQDPEANLRMTTLQAQRNFLEDRVLFSSAYRFSHMDNREFETIIESDVNGTPTNFSNPKQIRDARADNDYDAHTWVSSFMTLPWKWLSVGLRLKAEAIKRESNSSYPADASPNSTGGSTPNGVIDQNVVSLNENSAVRTGEGLTFRFTGIPRTALYTEFELEQARVLLHEDRKDLLGPNAGETFNRFTVADVDRFHIAMGGQSAPCSHATLTSQVSFRRNNNDYDDQRETDSTGTTARSAFFDGQRTDTAEWSTRVTFKPALWLQPSIRYQLRDDKFATRVENEPIVKTGMLSHIVTADLAWQPAQDLMTTLSFSRQMAATYTPGRYSATNIPTFNANVNTGLVSADYAFTPKWSWSGTLQYSWADNFNDFSEVGLPFGVRMEQLDLTAKLNWSVAPDTSVSVEYGFYHYLPDSNADTGDYDAHMIWLEASRKF